MWHPFLAYADQTLTWWLVLLLVLSGFCFFSLESLGRRLRSTAAPLGIVSLQSADSAEASRVVVASWDAAARDAAHRNLCLDFVFIPLYTTALAILTVMAARWLGTKGLVGMSSFAIALAWGPWLLGLLDVAENSTLLRALQVYPDIPQSLARLTTWCARLKFLLIAMAITCGFFGLLGSLS